MVLDINIDKNDAKRMYYDLIKYLSIAFIIHMLLYAVDDHEFLSEFALKIFLYITVAIVVYHLIIKKFAEKFIKI